ncbi:Predicted ATP-dependent endonuclease of the OLD family, contains P-loop ATPase and TOPRIM domains [Massilia sp. PDC64]|nr:AAA family ATPase [Massilia sp. PDC64]SDC26622.1 Predicted ATP-dependent endonuclease of the OLD family, contains P-loop ATPase and TOPRIM domains [Massilia sp. PDC64]
MRLTRYTVRNFRRLEDVTVNLEEAKTIYVGANNAGKTSATAVFRLFMQRTSFRIHDFSSGILSKLDALVKNPASNGQSLPSIDLDLWFSVDSKTEYGRVARLIPNLTAGVVEVGLGMRLMISDLRQLLKEYGEAFPDRGDGSSRKALTHFLGIDSNLRRHFSISYYRIKSLTNDGKTELSYLPVDAKEGRATLASLLRVDFVDAQRNIDDEASSRSNQLSSVFYDFYTSNLNKLPSDAEALLVIEKSNTDLTGHYHKEFQPLIEIIAELGYPTPNDRDLRVISNLSPEKALGGNALLSYFDPDSEHLLPEAYNGLGFKNLVYISVQIAHFQIQWAAIESERPLCHLIFVEEPEVHLHVQVQQTFLTQIDKVIKKTVEKIGGDAIAPQLIVTTHSSHIVSVAEFSEVRYFKKVPSTHAMSSAAKLKNTASIVLNLAKFNETQTDAKNLIFLKKYLALPHCDLFFADAVIMIEGTVEGLLLPQVIRREFANLQSRYITTLQVGGAFAHRFIPLLQFLGLSCLIVTDLDSVDPTQRNITCIGGHPDAVTANATIKDLLLDAKNKKANLTAYNLAKSVSSLVKLPTARKVLEFENSKVMVAFQTPVPMPSYGANFVFIPRTFEESFIFHNIELFRKKELECNIDLESEPDALVDYFRVHNGVHSNFAKVDFCLSTLASTEPWVTPNYLADGLKWLCDVLQSEV